MSLPIFFTKETASLYQSLMLDEDTSRHVSQVLRMRTGEELQLTDGKGNLLTGEITDAHKKHTTVRIINSTFVDAPPRKVIIAISLLKNANRFEWFLEKATELGIREIVPLLCERTERQHFRYDRMHAVLVSAMLQSQQTWLPELHEPVKLTEFIKSADETAQKFVGYLDEEQKKNLSESIDASRDGIALIGPEGDFTKDEIDLALKHGFIPVSLGETRLRTETAGVVAAVLLSRHIPS
jgi:16S rRNA (uracil1498-N3)-methyltransferase